MALWPLIYKNLLLVRREPCSFISVRLACSLLLILSHSPAHPISLFHLVREHLFRSCSLWPVAVQTIIFCLVVCLLLLIIGWLVRVSTLQSDRGTASGLALTTWLGGQPPAYFENGKPVWTDEQILTQADAFNFVLSTQATTGLINARLGLRLVYTSASSTEVQDALFDYAFKVCNCAQRAYRLL